MKKGVNAFSCSLVGNDAPATKGFQFFFFFLFSFLGRSMPQICSSPRFIGLKLQGRMIFVYIGGYDDCQRWIENNRENRKEIDSSPVLIKDEALKAQCGASQSQDPVIDEYEEQLLARLDEQIIRDIFSGLC